jgi:3-hydroxyisobutyrate dehydrogenase-like beta-hydroxyacid dehydrogenase
MRYGFVGLGQMGYPMAMNLLRKTAGEGNAGTTFMVYDVNPLSLSRFMNESEAIPGARVSVALHPKDLAEKSVRSPWSLDAFSFYFSVVGVLFLRACVY